MSANLLECAEPQRICITQGETKDINVCIISKDTKKAFDLTGVTGVKAIFEKADGTTLEKTLGSGVVVVSEPRGEIKISLTTADTLLLKVGESQDFEIELTFPTKVVIAQVLESLDVKARLFA